MNIFKLLKGAKFDYDQIKEENVIRNSNFQFFVSDHLKLLNYSDLTQHFLFISLDFSILKVINSGRFMLNSKRNTYVLTQTDPSYRKLERLAQV